MIGSVVRDGNSGHSHGGYRESGPGCGDENGQPWMMELTDPDGDLPVWSMKDKEHHDTPWTAIY
jgi:hypothetical protein